MEQQGCASLRRRDGPIRVSHIVAAALRHNCSTTSQFRCSCPESPDWVVFPIQLAPARSFSALGKVKVRIARGADDAVNCRYRVHRLGDRCDHHGRGRLGIAVSQKRQIESGLIGIVWAAGGDQPDRRIAHDGAVGRFSTKDDFVAAPNRF